MANPPARAPAATEQEYHHAHERFGRVSHRHLRAGPRRLVQFYCDALGMSIVSDVIQDTTTGGLPHVYAHSRATRRQVRLAYAGGAKPTLTMTSHPGEDSDGSPIKLDQVGISHIRSAFQTPKPSPKTCPPMACRWPLPWTCGPTLRDGSAASTSTIRTASWSSSTPADRGIMVRNYSHPCGRGCVNAEDDPP